MITYREAGVNIEEGDEVVRKIKPLVRETFTPGVLKDIGAFGAFFKPDLGDYQHPVLVSSVDGVGTKLKVAFRMERHDTVGQDLVNHCVNDIAVCGAQPLFFLDYFSTGKLSSRVAYSIVEGFATACKENGCALIGGETAEMPDLYREGEYDLAGTIVGIVDQPKILTGEHIKAGDLLVGLPSTGLHTNGYSLARKVLFARYDVADTPSQLGGRSLGEALLRIHRSYLQPIQHLHREDRLKGAAHVTGGGILGNVGRIVPDHLDIDVDYARWDRPALFSLIQEAGSVPEEDMRTTFNLGIGMIFVIEPGDESSVFDALRHLNEHPVIIGNVRSKASS